MIRGSSRKGRVALVRRRMISRSKMRDANGRIGRRSRSRSKRRNRGRGRSSKSKKKVVESAAQEHEWCDNKPAVGDGKDAGADANEDGTEAAEAAAAVRKALRAAGAFESWECCQNSVPKTC